MLHTQSISLGCSLFLNGVNQSLIVVKVGIDIVHEVLVRHALLLYLWLLNLRCLYIRLS